MTLFNSPYPYGKTNIEEINQFEKSINAKLPKDYVDYLLNYNGSKPIKEVFVISDSDSSRVHAFNGLHTGPEYSRLEQSFYDGVSVEKTFLLPFAYDPFNNAICLYLDEKSKHYGHVFFVEIGSNYTLNEATKLADNFNEFILSLETEEESDKRIQEQDPELWNDFQERLALMKKLHEEENK